MIDNKKIHDLDGGHASICYDRKCPKCSAPTILCDGGFETCSVCDFSSKELQNNSLKTSHSDFGSRHDGWDCGGRAWEDWWKRSL